MAPKRSKKAKYPSSAVGKASTSTSGPRLHISVDNENRLRRLLLNNERSVPRVNPSPELISRERKIKRLSNIYERLSLEGFSDDHIERGLSALQDTATFETALDWLCFNLPRNDLPLKFSTGTSVCVTEGSVGILSRGNGCEFIPSDQAAMVDEHVEQFSVKKMESRRDEPFELCEPSQADWVRKYLLQQEEEESESWEQSLGTESIVVKNPKERTFDVIAEEYNAARHEAAKAKEKRDKKSQDLASERIRQLKEELYLLGFSYESIARDIDEKYNNRSDVEHSFTDSMISEDSQKYTSTGTRTEASIVNAARCMNPIENLAEPSTCATKVEDVEVDELGNLDIGGLFMNDDISNDLLNVKVAKFTTVGKDRDLFSEKTLQLFSGIWKKGDPQKSPKALLQQMCLKFGWEAPKFTKLNSKNNKFSYSVSVLRNSTGRGKSRKGGGLLTFELPDDETFEKFEDAQNRVAAIALYHLFPDVPFHLVLVEPYASHALHWEQEHCAKNADQNIKDRRDNFVKKLLMSTDQGSCVVSDVENKVVGRSEENSVVNLNQRSSYSGPNDSRTIESVRLRQHHERKLEMKEYQENLKLRDSLPIAGVRSDILQMLKDNNVILVCGETGSGKTTQVPQFVLDEMILADTGGFCSIICTQPRRIAAISVAERVAEERCESPPGTDNSLIGYQVRLQSARNDNTKLLFCTTGILLRKLSGDRNLSGVTHVIVDEVHERSILGDFLLIILKNLLEKQAAVKASPLKVILMSATIDVALFSRYFADCPVINVEGRTHPVTKYYLEDVYENLNYVLPIDSSMVLGYEHTLDKDVLVKNHKGDKNTVMQSWGDDFIHISNPHFTLADYGSYSEQTQRNLKRLNEDMIDYDLLEELVNYIDDTYNEGAMLIFMPGLPEINRLADKLVDSYRFGGSSADWIFRLHSSMSPQDQKNVFKRPPTGVRKIIISTNIAETSVTIDDVVFVIDCGKHKENRYDPQKKLKCLVEDWISRANARQRHGRAGRVKPGISFCLYTRYRYEKFMRPYQVPEMLRMPLVELCLQIQLLSMGHAKPVLLKALEPPKEEAVDDALSLLYEVGALEGEEVLTPLGHLLAKLPVDVLIGKMMLFGTIFGCLSPILSISAFLSYKQPFSYPKNEQCHAERAKAALLAEPLAANKSSNLSDAQSDHIVMMMAYQKWAHILHEKGAKAAMQFCDKFCLSSSVMHMIRDMRAQFGALLAEIGFFRIPDTEFLRKTENLDRWLSDASRPFNAFSHHPSLVKAILLAGLYPNIAATGDGMSAAACARLERSSGQDAGARAWFDGRRRIHIHPTSVNSSRKSFRSPFIVFLEKVETNKVSVRDTTVVSPYCMLLFGGRMRVEHQSGVVVVDEWLKVGAAAQTAVLFSELRKALQSLLKKLILNPKEAVNTENELIRSVVQLLVDEDKKL